MCLVAFMASCSYYRDIKETLIGVSTPSLKKRMAMLPFHSLLPKTKQRFHLRATRLMGTLLRQSGHYVIVSAKTLNLSPMQAAGVTDSYAEKIVAAGKKAGLNVVVVGLVTDLAVVSKLVGLWGFREPAPFLKLEMEARVYHVPSETLLMRITQSALMEMTEIETMLMRRGKLPLGEGVDKMIYKICRKLAKEIKSRLAKQHWTGFVLRRQGKMVVINAGQDCGVKQGNTFIVRRPGTPIKTATGRFYRLPGPVIGRVQVVGPGPATSLARPYRVTVDDIPPGSTIHAR